MKMQSKYLRQRILMIFCLLLFLTPFRISGANTLYMPAVSAGPNSNVTIAIGVTNSDPFNSFQFDLMFPLQLKWVSESIRLTSREQGHILSATLIEPGRLRIISYSLTNTDFAGTSGSLVEADFATDYQPGTYPVSFENATLGGNDRNILDNAVNGQFTLLSSRLETSLDEIDFGRIPLLNEDFRSLTLTNTGNLSLTVNGLVFSDTRFSSSELLPFALLPGQSKLVQLRFYSETKGALEKSLTILSDNPAGDKTCVLKATAFAVNEIHPGSVSGRSGYETEIPVSVNNMEEFCALQFRIPLPTVARFVKGSESLNELRKTDHILSADTSGNVLTILAFSPSNSNFKGNEGNILNFSLFLEGKGGSYPVSLVESVISNSTSVNILSASYGFNVGISAPKINLNTSELDFGEVSVLQSGTMDLTIFNTGNDPLHVSNIIVLENPFFSVLTPVPFTILHGNNKNLSIRFEAADGKLHVSKLRIRSNDSAHDPIDINMRAKSFFPNEIRIMDCQTTAGSKDTIYVELFNQSLVNGFQFDLEYPDCLNIDPSDVFLTARKDDHMVAVSEISSGKLRILSYSGSLKYYSGKDGVVLGIPVQVASGINGTYPLLVTGLVISDIRGTPVETGQKSGNILIQTATAIDAFSGIKPEIYPNPAGDYLIIDHLAASAGSFSYEIYSAYGILLFADTFDPRPNGFRIGIAQLKPGLYYLYLKTSIVTKVYNFIKLP